MKGSCKGILMKQTKKRLITTVAKSEAYQSKRKLQSVQNGTFVGATQNAQRRIQDSTVAYHLFISSFPLLHHYLEFNVSKMQICTAQIAACAFALSFGKCP